MREYAKRRNNPHESLHFFLMLALVVLLLVVAGFAASSAWGMYGKFAHASSASENAEYELLALRGERAHVEAELASLATARGVEAHIRERFGVVRPGEGQIQIVRDHEASQVPEHVSSSGALVGFFQGLFPW